MPCCEAALNAILAVGLQIRRSPPKPLLSWGTCVIALISACRRFTPPNPTLSK